MIAAVVAAIAMACAPAAEVPIPTVGNLEAVRDGETEVLLARVTVGGAVVGFALSCADARPLMTVYLGPFAPRLQALQLATRTAAGAVTLRGRPCSRRACAVAEHRGPAGERSHAECIAGRHAAGAAGHGPGLRSPLRSW